jgi:hypothetical protein
MKERKSYKFAHSLKKIAPRLKWFLFTEMQDLKLTSDYINFICPGSDKSDEKALSNPVGDLRNLIEQSLVREFSPKIRNLKSFSILVDMVMYNVQKRALEDDDELEQLLAE